MKRSLLAVVLATACVLSLIPGAIKAEKAEAASATATRPTITVIKSSNTKFSLPTQNAPGKWVKYSQGWWWKYPNGTWPASKLEKINNYYYYFGEDGYMVNGWLAKGDLWYRFDYSGEMVRENWRKIGKFWYYMNKDGVMHTGPLKYLKWDYFMASWGPMYSNAWALQDGIWYWYGETGEKAKNRFIEYKGNRYYVDKDGKMLTGRQTIDNRQYIFHDSGEAYRNYWSHHDGQWRRYGDSGAMITNDWSLVGDTWYFFKEDGQLVSDCWKQIKGKWYRFDKDGQMLSSQWTFSRSAWYYLKESGAMAENEWVLVEGLWYYLGKDGIMLTGTHKIDGKTYKFDSSGAWITGLTDYYGWQAGYIIADKNFYTQGDMDAKQIQNFLNEKGSNCSGNLCLKNYWGYMGSFPAQLGCSAVQGGNMSGAEMIYRVSKACKISAKVLLVTLQKENSLVTNAAWVNGSRNGFQTAMGFACPDTAPCNTEYYGIGNQIYHAAKQFNNYRLNASRFNYRAGQTAWIGYNPNSSCGGSYVYIRNAATAGLYNYTPYQPNAAALAAKWTGNSCSTYGNRNFFRQYSDWFGDPRK